MSAKISDLYDLLNIIQVYGLLLMVCICIFSPLRLYKYLMFNIAIKKLSISIGIFVLACVNLLVAIYNVNELKIYNYDYIAS